MNMKYFNKSAVIVSLLFFTVAVSAQEEMNKDVKVVREYTPIISDAYKINEMPASEEDDHLDKIGPFDYNILTKAMMSDMGVVPISPAKLRPEHKEVLDKSYVKGALGNYNTLYGELFYNILRSEEYALGLNVGHISSMGKLELEDETKVDAPYHDTWTSLYFRRFYDEHTLSIDANFLHNVYNYYGYQSLDKDVNYLNDVGESVLGSDLIPDDRQRLSGFNANIGFGNKQIETSDIPYHLNLKLGTFGNVTGVNESNFGLGGEVGFEVSDNLTLNILGSMDYFGTTVPESTALYDFYERKMTLLNISPAIGFSFDGFNVNVGVDTYSQFGSDIDTEFNIAPHIVGDLIIAEGIVTAFGGVKGDYHVNNYQTIQRENQFVSPDENVKNSFHGLHLFGGMKGNFSSSVSFVARVDYSIFQDEHFYINRSFDTDATESVTSQSNLFDVVYDDGNLFSVSGELKFEPHKNLNVLLFGKYNGWTVNNLEYAWHKPDSEINLRINFSPMEDLWVNVGLNTLGSRYAYDVESNLPKKLKSVVDVNVGAHYMVSSKWNVFASMNNLVASKYYQWNGYPMQGFNMKIGVGYSF